MGYHKAGFDVVGVDLSPQPNYPFKFVQADALALSMESLAGFDCIHASPPCQAHTAMRTMHNAKEHLDLIARTRAMLRASGKPYVIENVVGAPLLDPTLLCGSMFGLGIPGAELRRHRLFETSFALPELQCSHDKAKRVIGLYGGHVRNRRRRAGSQNRGVADFTVEDGFAAMGIDWPMTLTELSQSIPPAFTEHIGAVALAYLADAPETAIAA
jgi:DNA (cytosine-5)-methyltransferase 1